MVAIELSHPTHASHDKGSTFKMPQGLYIGRFSQLVDFPPHKKGLMTSVMSQNGLGGLATTGMLHWRHDTMAT